MLSEKVNYKNIELKKHKKFYTDNHTYIEYRNDKLQKIKFFEVIDDELKDIVDINDFKKALDKNYIIDNGVIE